MYCLPPKYINTLFIKQNTHTYAIWLKLVLTCSVETVSFGISWINNKSSICLFSIHHWEEQWSNMTTLANNEVHPVNVPVSLFSFLDCVMCHKDHLDCLTYTYSYVNISQRIALFHSLWQTKVCIVVYSFGGFSEEGVASPGQLGIVELMLH